MRSEFDNFKAAFAPHRTAGYKPARIFAAHKDRWELRFWREADGVFADGDQDAVLTGRFRHEAKTPADFPVVGDWVAAETGAAADDQIRIAAILPRAGLLARKRPGDIDHDIIVEQAIAANIDLALLAMAVDDDFSPNRLSRYLTLAWDAGTEPVVLLTKADLSGTGAWPPLEERRQATAAAAFGARIIVASVVSGEGLAELKEILKPGVTAIMLGSSGVGKSSLLNAIAGGAVQAVRTVRAFDGKGRHTTTARRLFELPWGAYLADTPGLRELQLWGDESSLEGAFPDIEAMAADCRFADCRHGEEPGCAVRAAQADGILTLDRLAAWEKLRKELAYLNRKTDVGAARAERAKWKAIAKFQRTLK